MDERKNRPDPTHSYQNQIEEELAKTLAPEREETEDQTIDTDSPTGQTKEEPSPPEAFMRAWEFIKQPEHANAIMAFFTILIFLATSAYAVIAVLQWNAMRDQLGEMQKSNEMERRRAEDQEEAVCRLHTYGLAPLEHVQDVHVINSGKVKARSIVAHVDISLNDALSNKKIRDLGTVDISGSELPGNDQTLEKQISLPLTGVDWKQLADTDQVIVDSGHVQYENGFGRLVDEPFCEGWWFFRTPSDKNNPIQGRGNDCGLMPANIAGIKKNPPH